MCNIIKFINLIIYSNNISLYFWVFFLKFLKNLYKPLKIGEGIYFRTYNYLMNIRTKVIFFELHKNQTLLKSLKKSSFIYVFNENLEHLFHYWNLK